jgi:hypothetical protein
VTEKYPIVFLSTDGPIRRRDYPRAHTLLRHIHISYPEYDFGSLQPCIEMTNAKSISALKILRTASDRKNIFLMRQQIKTASIASVMKIFSAVNRAGKNCI